MSLLNYVKLSLTVVSFILTINSTRPSAAISTDAYITTTTSSNSDAKVILINDTRNSSVNKIVNNEWYLQCYSNNEAVTFWGLKIELRSSSFGFKANDITTIEIAVNDIQKDGDLDIVTAFSVNDKYFANINSADGFFSIENGSNGQYIFPVRSSNLARNNDLEHVFSNVNSDVNTWRTQGNNDYSKSLTTSGILHDWTRISSHTGTDRSSFIYKVTNDGINNKTYFEFTSGNVNYKCDYNESFDTDSDIYFYIQNDCKNSNHNEKSWITSINITSGIR